MLFFLPPPRFPLVVFPLVGFGLESFDFLGLGGVVLLVGFGPLGLVGLLSLLFVKSRQEFECHLNVSNLLETMIVYLVS